LQIAGASQISPKKHQLLYHTPAAISDATGHTLLRIKPAAPLGAQARRRIPAN